MTPGSSVLEFFDWLPPHTPSFVVWGLGKLGNNKMKSEVTILKKIKTTQFVHFTKSKGSLIQRFLTNLHWNSAFNLLRPQRPLVPNTNRSTYSICLELLPSGRTCFEVPRRNWDRSGHPKRSRELGEPPSISSLSSGVQAAAPLDSHTHGDLWPAGKNWPAF